jgi:hypothetical protein
MYDSESSSEAGWIEWFCDLEGHEFFVSVSHNTFLQPLTPPPYLCGGEEVLIPMTEVLTCELPL